MLWCRDRNTGRSLATLSRTALQKDSRREGHEPVTVAVILLFANVGGKCSREQVSWRVIAQGIGSRTAIRAVAANLPQAIVELRAARSSAFEFHIVAVLPGVTIRKRNAPELPSHLRALVSTRTDDWIERKGTGRISLNRG
jgi:hypothetical protein